MFDHTSRYATLPTLTLKRDGRTVTYASRRFIPRSVPGQTTVQVPIQEGDRLDNLAAAMLGAPELYWHICDANSVANPAELEVAGRRIAAPLPGLQRK